jgi:AcrR family transcriptional regulator
MTRQSLNMHATTIPRRTAAAKTPNARPAPPRPPARQRRKEARPQELLDAALELFVEKGFAATRSEEVAARAGVSKGTLYLYFQSKEELFKAVVRSNLSSLIAQGQDAVDAYDGSSADLLRFLITTWSQRVGSSKAGGITKVIMAEVRNFPDLAQFWVDEVILPAHKLLSRTLQQGVARGEFRPVPIRAAVHALVAPSIFLSMQKHTIGACPVRGYTLLDEREVIDTQLDLVLHGLTVRQPMGLPGKTPTIKTTRKPVKRRKTS